MNKLVLNSLEVAPDSVVLQAARDFAEALSETAQFHAYEEVSFRFQQDDAAQKAMQNYQKKQQSLRIMFMLNAVSPEEQAELDRLQNEWLAYDSVKTYMQAQNVFLTLCQVLGDLISEQTALNYSSACGISCCG